MKKLITILPLFFSLDASAYISCSNVSVKLETSSAPSFHNFSERGITGGTFFINISGAACADSAGNPLSTTRYLVIDKVDTADELKKVWISMLLSAEARGKTISFHGYDLGVTSSGRQVIQPYYLYVN